MMQFKTTKSSKQQQSEKQLKQLREYLRKQAESAIKQIKQNQQLSLSDIRQAQALFQNPDQIDKYLKKKNQIKKKQNVQKDKQKSLQKGKQVQKQKQKPTYLKQKQNKKAPNNKKDHIQISIVKYDQNRKWNETLQNPKVGKFQPQQSKILLNSLNQYLTQHNIDLERFISSIGSDQAQKTPNDLKLWTTVCSVLPNRTLISSYKFLMRKLNIRNRTGKWTQIQQQDLLVLQQKYGNKWKIIATYLGRTPQNVRDKFRNLQKRSKQDNTKFWKIEQLIKFIKSLQKCSKVNFIKDGIENLQKNAEQHNKKQEQLKKTYKYNSKFMICHNNLQIMEFVDTDKFGQINRDKLKWKQISTQIGTRSQSQCRNKYIQFMEIFNRDYNGQSQYRVLEFLSRQIQKVKDKIFGQQVIQWERWPESSLKISKQQAKIKWLLVKKKIKNRSQKSFKQILDQALQLNQKKLIKIKLRQQQKQQKQILQKQAQGKGINRQKDKIFNKKQIQKQNNQLALQAQIIQKQKQKVNKQHKKNEGNENFDQKTSKQKKEHRNIQKVKKSQAEKNQKIKDVKNKKIKKSKDQNKQKQHQVEGQKKQKEKKKR